MRLLVVEDDASIGEPLVEGLRLHGFDVEHAVTGREALAAASHVDLVLLDLGLPDLDGLEVLRRLRAAGDVPVIVLTARESEMDRVLGFEVGADDYVPKPFSLRELVGRIRAVSRRTLGAADRRQVVGPTAGDPLTVAGDLVVDRRAHRVTVAGQTVDLAPREFELLSVLARDVGATFGREQLMDEVWDSNWFGSTKTLDVHVAQLRRKLGGEGRIETIRGVGFRLNRFTASGPDDDGP